VSLPGKTALIRACYPEGNFEGNQLLEDSISLSPLCPCSTNDLHVSIATTFHQNFFWLQPTQVKFIFFRVVSMHLLFPRGASPKRERNCGRGLAPDRFPMLSLRLQVYHPSTRHTDTLLGPCFKTGQSISPITAIRGELMSLRTTPYPRHYK